MVSISPVPKLEPGPVSYCQLDDGSVCAGPLKSSLNTVDQPGGGAGTAAGKAAARAVAAREAAAGVVAAATAGTAGAVSAMIDVTIFRGRGGVNTGICLAVVGYGSLASPCAAMDEGNGLRHSGEVRTRAASTSPRAGPHGGPDVQQHIHGVSGTRHEGHERRMGAGNLQTEGTCGTGGMNAPSKHYGR